MDKIKFFLSALSAIRAVWAQIKALDAVGVKRGSDQWWLELRKWWETRIVELTKRQDKGILGLFQSDNQFFRGNLLLLKSQHLKEIAEAKGDLAKHNAEARLYSKSTTPVYRAQ